MPSFLPLSFLILCRYFFHILFTSDPNSWWLWQLPRCLEHSLALLSECHNPCMHLAISVKINIFSEHMCLLSRQTKRYNNMNGPRGYYAKWNKSDREIQVLYIQNLKSKTKKQIQQNRNRLTELVVARGERGQGMGKQMKGIKRHILPVIK